MVALSFSGYKLKLSPRILSFWKENTLIDTQITYKYIYNDAAY
jgi:hypothetical protein